MRHTQVLGSQNTDEILIAFGDDGIPVGSRSASSVDLMH